MNEHERDKLLCHLRHGMSLLGYTAFLLTALALGSVIGRLL